MCQLNNVMDSWHYSIIESCLPKTVRFSDGTFFNCWPVPSMWQNIWRYINEYSLEFKFFLLLTVYSAANRGLWLVSRWTNPRLDFFENEIVDWGTVPCMLTCAILQGCCTGARTVQFVAHAVLNRHLLDKEE